MDAQEAVVQQRSLVRFLHFEGVSGTEIYRRLQKLFKEEVMSKSSIYEWIAKFKNGQTSVKDAARCGRPVTVGDHLENRVNEMVQENQRVTVRELAARVGISKFSIAKILNELDYHKVCAKWIPKNLTQEQVNICRESLASVLYTQRTIPEVEHLVVEPDVTYDLPNHAGTASDIDLQGKNSFLQDESDEDNGNEIENNTKPVEGLTNEEKTNFSNLKKAQIKKRKVNKAVHSKQKIQQKKVKQQPKVKRLVSKN